MKERYIASREIFIRLYNEILKINVFLPRDVEKAIKNAHADESGLGKKVLSRILQNIDMAKKKKIPLCQDTGLVIVFVEIGQNIRIDGGNLEEIIHNSIAAAYRDGYFRNSIVEDPVFSRNNTQNNLPPVIYYDITKEDKLKISILVKGFGSENCSSCYMLKPTDGVNEIIDAVCDTMKKADGMPCPPVIIGVGIGGTMDYAAKLSKKALLRSLDDKNPHRDYAAIENEIFSRVNQLGLGPGGLGGKYTTIGVKIEKHATHIAGLPVAVSVNCWADRRAIIEM